MRKQQESIGPALLKALPPGQYMSERSSQFSCDGYLLPPAGNAHQKLIETLESQGKKDGQARSVIAINEANQCGKTKLFYSIACDPNSDWAVVNIRFVTASMTDGTPAFLSLKESLRSAKRELHPTLHIDALFYIRAYILSHLLWLLVLSENHKTEDLRLIWLLALRGGDGEASVDNIYRKLTEGVFTTRSRSALMCLWSASLESLGAFNRKILFAFDKVSMASGQLKNIVFRDWQGKGSQGNVEAPTDLLSGFAILFKRILEYGQIFAVATADTRFSMRVFGSLNTFSPLGGFVIQWSKLQLLSEENL